MYSISKKDFLYNLNNSEDSNKLIMSTIYEADSKFGRKVMKLNDAIEIIRKKEMRREKLEQVGTKYAKQMGVTLEEFKA